MGVVLQMTMVMMTSLAVTRETERGTIENLLATPASPAEIMLGKILPYLVVGGVQVVVVLTAAKLLFGVPFVGSLSLLLSAVLAFVLSLVLLGYTIDGGPHADAGHAIDVLLLPAVAAAVRLHVRLSRHARLGTDALLDSPAHAFPEDRAGSDAEGRRLFRDRQRVGALTIFILVFAGLALVRFRRTLD